MVYPPPTTTDVTKATGNEGRTVAAHYRAWDNHSIFIRCCDRVTEPPIAGDVIETFARATGRIDRRHD
jgi:hypothetical protein